MKPPTPPARRPPTPPRGHDTGSRDQPAPRPSGTHGKSDSLAPVGTAAGSAVLVAATASPTPASAASATPASPLAAADQVPVVVGGRTVGTVVIDFPSASQSAA
jgi:hypothetical protein